MVGDEKKMGVRERIEGIHQNRLRTLMLSTVALRKHNDRLEAEQVANSVGPRGRRVRAMGGT